MLTKRGRRREHNVKEADKEQHLVDSDKEWCHLDFLGVPSLNWFSPLQLLSSLFHYPFACFGTTLITAQIPLKSGPNTKTFRQVEYAYICMVGVPKLFRQYEKCQILPDLEWQELRVWNTSRMQIRRRRVIFPKGYVSLLLLIPLLFPLLPTQILSRHWHIIRAKHRSCISNKNTIQLLISWPNPPSTFIILIA